MTDAPTVALPTNRFAQLLAPHLLEAIAREAGASFHCASICVLDKRCYAICSRVLYGQFVRIHTHVALRALHNTLLVLQPKYRLLVKALEFGINHISVKATGTRSRFTFVVL